jgi:adenylate cyclase
LKKNIFNRLSIQLKIISSISLILFITFLLVVFFMNIRQKDDLIREKNNGIESNNNILLINLRNIMLNGQAPLLIGTMEELKHSGGFLDISIYRTNGIPAFSDYSTLDKVNKNQPFIKFDKTDRIVDSRNNDLKLEETKAVMDTTASGKKFEITNIKNYEIENFFPIENLPQCMTCHGSDHKIRGVAHFKISDADIYMHINNNRNLLVVLGIGIGLALIIILFFLLKILIISPVIRIGSAVSEVGSGNFKIRLNADSMDEIGILSGKINDMIKGLDERFKLAKYVSKTTEDLITSQDGELNFNAEKKEITILFSDIRGFTSYSEVHKPEEVIEHLNKVLQAQTRIVEKFNGDIDKFVGDELMAIFKDEFSAVSCAIEMMKAVERVDREINQNLKIGIGINSGQVVAGNIGSESRMEYAVIGDSVNLASRLCSFAGPGTILISENIYNKIKSLIDAKLVPNKQVKGKKEPVNIYIVKGLTKQG